MFYRPFAAVAVALLMCVPAHATPIRRIAGPVQQVLTIEDSDLQGTSVTCSSGWDAVPGAKLAIAIPPGANQLLVARFTSGGIATDPNQGNAYGWVRIVAGVREMLPDATLRAYSVVIPQHATTFSLERSLVVVPGTRVVSVQYCADGAQFFVWDWHLTVEAAPVQ